MHAIAFFESELKTPKQKRLAINSVRFLQCHLIDPFFFSQQMTLKYTRITPLFIRCFSSVLISLYLIHHHSVYFETENTMHWMQFDNNLAKIQTRITVSREDFYKWYTIKIKYQFWIVQLVLLNCCWYMMYIVGL